MLSVLTINHNNSEISFLERFSFDKESINDALRKLKEIPGVDECLILSTCNRVELYVSSKSTDISSHLVKFLSEFHSLEIEKSPIIYQLMSGSDAVYHLFKVASGIDSMILGEPQIINQIKDSYNKANELNTVGPNLHRLVQMSLRVSKKVRNETNIGSKSESISNLALKFSKKIFESLTDKKALIIGAGEMSQLFVDSLKNENIKEIFIASRDIKNSITFCDKFGGKPVQFENIYDLINDVDIFFTATGSNEFLLKPNDFDEIKTRDKLLIDIALPRDIDPRIGDKDFCYLYDLDDFKSLSIDNNNNYSTSMKEAVSIINQNVESFESWQYTSSLKDLILSFQNHIQEIVNNETKSNPGIDKNLLAQRISNKILHSPLAKIKSELRFDKISIKLIEDLFNLNLKKEKIIDKIDDARNKNRYQK